MRHPVVPAGLLLTLIASALYMLDMTPIVWIDEVMFVDIGRNIAEGKGMISRLWHFEGSEIAVLAHMPLWQVYLGAWYLVLPDTVFMSRLPGFFTFLCTILFAFFYFRQQVHTLSLALLFTFLLAGDKAVFEAARSMRMDILGAALFMGLVALKSMRKHAWLSALISGCLVLVHPVFWIASAFFFMDIWVWKKYQWKYLLLPIIPILLFLIYIRTHIELLPGQLLANGGDHRAGQYPDLIQRIIAFFQNRYFSWYEAQQLMPILTLISLIAGALLFISRKELRFWSLLIWAQFIFLLLTVGDYPRYNLPLTLSVWCMLPILLPYLLPDTQLKKWPVTIRYAAWICVLSLAMYPCASRAISTLAQQEERNPTLFLSWLHAHLPETEKTLIVDEAIGFYSRKPHQDFTLLHTMDKFNFKDYPGGVYWLCYQPDAYIGHTHLAEYSVQANWQIPFLPKAVSYAGLRLYRIQTAEQYENIAALYRTKTELQP
jgi:hypothetical protein